MAHSLESMLSGIHPRREANGVMGTPFAVIGLRKRALGRAPREIFAKF